MVDKLTTTNIVKKTASAKVVDTGAEIYAIVLAAGSDTATVTLYNSEDDSGTEVCKLAAVANSTESVTFCHPIFLSNGAYVAITGTDAEVSISYK